MFSSELLGLTRRPPAVWWREERCTAAPGGAPTASNCSLTAQVRESPADVFKLMRLQHAESNAAFAQFSCWRSALVPHKS